MDFGRFKRFLVGEPLAAMQAGDELIPKWKALPTLSSDALSSVAYATEASLAVLVAASAAAVAWSVPIALAIIVLLAILTISYHQTFDAYPTGGGAYTVAKENLGESAGLVAGAALLIDYVLTVSVSVAAGIENIGSALPFLLQYQTGLGVLVIGIVMLMNLRGVRESATAFAFPTYFFILSVFVLIGAGIWKWLSGESPEVGALPAALPAVPLLLILRAFGSGCAALTGVEAISNSISVFQPPAPRNAKITLVWMSVILALAFLGISTLARVFGIVPQADQTVISLLGRTIFGATLPYYAIQLATALILFLAANTSYTGFPRLASLLAKDRYLPRQLASQGDRLVFSNGIIGLSLASAAILALYDGVTLRLIPLYAIGVFLSFTLSQAGMVAHHFREKKLGWRRSLVINGLGALTTGVVLLDLCYTKFTHGAWIVLLAIPFFVFLFRAIHSHYIALGRQLSVAGEVPWARPVPVRHTVLIPISGIHRGILDAIRYGVSISDDVRACYVEINSSLTEQTQAEWEKWGPGIPFVVLKSPYRSVVEPLLRYVDDVKQSAHGDFVTVIIPEFITTRWWHRFLHNQSAIFVKAALMYKPGVVVTTVRYHLEG